MSQQQSQTATTKTARQGKPDTSEPTLERQAELHAAYEANVAAGEPPYDEVRIHTLGEVEWILRERDWSVDDALAKGKHRPDLRGADLSESDLSGADLSYAYLGDADLSDSDLSGANLSWATLKDALLTVANLTGADLSHSDLSGAFMSSVILSGADLGHTDLSGAGLAFADLSGADLSDARMDGATTLDDAKFDSETLLGDIRWNGVPLTRVPAWPARLGDEQYIHGARNRHQRIEVYRVVARAYRGLSIVLRSQGLLIPASSYRLREQVLERKARLLEFSLLGWVFSWLLNLVAGYGERPVRSFVAYLLVLFGFAGAYFALGAGALAGLGLGAHDAITSPLSALVFSVTSFHGRGFFPGGLALDDPLTVLAALEAVIGLFIEITFIATFTQRFFGGR
jgi:hypothetical protein